MKFLCNRCRKVILKVDRRRRQPLVAQEGAILIQDPKVAPVVKCSCGLTTVFMKGAL